VLAVIKVLSCFYLENRLGCPVLGTEIFPILFPVLSNMVTPFLSGKYFLLLDSHAIRPHLTEELFAGQGPVGIN